MTFDEAFDALIGHEGGYSNNPNDPGGETMWGVTRRVAMEEGYQGPMRLLTRDAAKVIYRRRYWLAIRADELPALLRYPMFDAAVNSGPGQAIEWLQRSLRVPDDRVLGPRTLAAVGARDPVKLAVSMTAARLAFMTDLSTWGTFGRGWARRIADVLQETAA